MSIETQEAFHDIMHRAISLSALILNLAQTQPRAAAMNLAQH